MRAGVSLLGLGLGLGLVLGSGSLGCGGAERAAAPASVDGVLATLKSAGLAPGAMTTFDGDSLGGATCRRGPVSGIETTLCAFDDPSRAKKHEEAGLALVGEATGAALAEGKVLLIVADRDGIDKDGKTIDRITRAFRGRPLAAAK
jgi:hypothetical protein